MKELLQKLVKVKLKLEGVAKTSNNPYFKSKYADLNSHLGAIESLLLAEGLVLFQPCEIKDGKNIVTSRIYDSDTGQSIESSMELLCKDVDMQKLGSAVTYARRYTLSSLAAMKAEDDDGNIISNKVVPKTTTPTNVTPVVTTPTVSASVIQTANATTVVTQTETKPKASFRRPTPPVAVNVEEDI